MHNQLFQPMPVPEMDVAKLVARSGPEKQKGKTGAADLKMLKQYLGRLKRKQL